MKFGFPSLPFASANGQICALFLTALLRSDPLPLNGRETFSLVEGEGGATKLRRMRERVSSLILNPSPNDWEKDLMPRAGFPFSLVEGEGGATKLRRMRET
jgi:hypothetical protein